MWWKKGMLHPSVAQKTCDANPPRIYTTLLSSYDKAFTTCQVNAARSRLHGSFSCTCFVLSGTGYFCFLMLNSCRCNCEESWRIQEETGVVLILSLLSCMGVLNSFPNIISSLDRFEGLRLDISDCDLCCLWFVWFPFCCMLAASKEDSHA